MRDHTRIHSAALVMTLVVLSIIGAGCSGGEDQVSLEIRLADDTPADYLTPMHMTVWGGQETYYVDEEVQLDEHDVAWAAVTRQQDGVPAIHIELTEKGRRDLLRLTRFNEGSHLAILVDGQLQCVSLIDGPNPTGDLLITGHMLEGAARRCSEALTRNAARREESPRRNGRGPRADEPPA